MTQTQPVSNADIARELYELARDLYDSGQNYFAAACAALDSYSTAHDEHTKNLAMMIWIEAATQASERQIKPLLDDIKKTFPPSRIRASVDEIFVARLKLKRKYMPKHLRPENAHLLRPFDLN